MGQPLDYGYLVNHLSILQTRLAREFRVAQEPAEMENLIGAN